MSAKMLLRDYDLEGVALETKITFSIKKACSAAMPSRGVSPIDDLTIGGAMKAVLPAACFRTRKLYQEARGRSDFGEKWEAYVVFEINLASGNA